MSELNMEPFRKLIQRSPIQSLAPKKVFDPNLDLFIEQAQLSELLGTDVYEDDYAQAWKSGLHLWNDSLVKSHTLSQHIETQTGSYWHGIMHRMEPDYSNAKYWFRRVGSHPSFITLQHKVVEILGGESLDKMTHSKISTGLQRMSEQAKWDPDLFIDLVEIQLQSEDLGAKVILEKIQQLEIQILLQYTYHKSCGGTIFDSL